MTTYDPATDPPPKGKRILMKTKYGLWIIGKWNDDVAYAFVRWTYLPD